KSVKSVWLDSCDVNELQPIQTFASFARDQQKTPPRKPSFSAGFDRRSHRRDVRAQETSRAREEERKDEAGRAFHVEIMRGDVARARNGRRRRSDDRRNQEA